jgi:hypothetical protein
MSAIPDPPDLHDLVQRLRAEINALEVVRFDQEPPGVPLLVTLIKLLFNVSQTALKTLTVVANLPEPQETEASIAKWIAETFPGADPKSPRMALRLLEEAVELCGEAGATEDQIRETVERSLEDHLFLGLFNPQGVRKEAGDVYILLCGCGGLYGFSPHGEGVTKMAVNRTRTWHALGDGTGYHVEESSKETPHE